MNHSPLKRVLPAATALIIATTSTAQFRVALLEERTAGWCPACPSGITVGEELLHAYSGSMLMVAVHDAPADYVAALDAGFLPGAKVDRIGAALHVNSWGSGIAPLLGDVPVADITVARTYDSGTRLLTATVSAHFLSTPPTGDYRFAGIVVEDHVTGGGPQMNAYSGSPSPYAGIFADLPNPVPDSLMVYEHYGRALLGGYSGVAGSLPASPQVGQTWSHTFTYTIPASYDPEDVRIYGLLIDASNGEVLNAAASNYAAGTQNDAPYFTTASDTLRMLVGQSGVLSITTNDAESDKMQISPVGLLPSWASLNVTNFNHATLSVSGVPPGTWSVPLQVSDGIGTTVQQFTVIGDPIYDPWSVVGAAGFSAEENEGLPDVAVDAATGKVYVAHRNQYGKIKVYKWNGSIWSLVGSQMSAHADAHTASVAVEPLTGKPCVAFKTTANATKVMQYTTGSTWAQVGTALVPGGDPGGLVFMNGGTAYLATSNADVGAKVFTYDGSAWNALGGGAIALPGADQLGWPQLMLNADSGLVMGFVAHVDAGDSTWVGAAAWNGSDWEVLGGGSPWPHDVSYASNYKMVAGSDGSIHMALYHSGNVNVYKLNGGGWDAVGAFEAHNANDPYDLSVGSDGNVTLVYKSRYYRLNSVVYDGVNWYSAGDNFTAPCWSFASFTAPDGDPAVVYQDGGNANLLTTESLSDWNVGLEPIEVSAFPAALYPNPAFDVVNIRGAGKVTGDVRITDVLGRLVVSLPMTDGSIDVRCLEPGTYVLQLPKQGTSVRFVKR